MKRKLISTFLISCFVISGLLTGCQSDINPALSSVSQNQPLTSAESSIPEESYIAFSVDMLRMNYQANQNMLISPISIETALAMALAGANGETMNQINNVLGGEAGRDDILTFCGSFIDNLDHSDSFHAANSIWVNMNRHSPEINPDYGKTLDRIFHAEAYFEPFDDSTANTINKWVKKETDGMIPSVLEAIPENAMVYLINALSFESEWEEPYEEYQIRDYIFHNEDGAESMVCFLCEGSSSYCEIENACGFIKDYADNNFAFMAILPDEDICLEDFLNGFSAQDYKDFYESETYEYDVTTRLPKFEYDYETDLCEQLKMLGMTAAFDGSVADFCNILTDESAGTPIALFISRILHKTHITLDESGTKAAAVTVVEMRDNAAPLMEDQTREVILDRPFVYAIIDTQTGLPVFFGTVNQL